MTNRFDQQIKFARREKNSSHVDIFGQRSRDRSNESKIGNYSFKFHGLIFSFFLLLYTFCRIRFSLPSEVMLVAVGEKHQMLLLFYSCQFCCELVVTIFSIADGVGRFSNFCDQYSCWFLFSSALYIFFFFFPSFLAKSTQPIIRPFAQFGVSLQTNTLSDRQSGSRAGSR